MFSAARLTRFQTAAGVAAGGVASYQLLQSRRPAAGVVAFGAAPAGAAPGPFGNPAHQWDYYQKCMVSKARGAAAARETGVERGRESALARARPAKAGGKVDSPSTRLADPQPRIAIPSDRAFSAPAGWRHPELRPHAHDGHADGRR